MAFDNRLFRGLLHESTASAPSMRASAPVEENAPEDGGNVKVVVRVRQFIPREIEVNAKCVVRMDSQTQKTILLPPSFASSDSTKSRKPTEEREFIFDKSFCSFNPLDPEYSTQESVYNSFASDFLDHNFDGFHTCIFAYGQTGSGKSYTMMGRPDCPGLIPRYCRSLFQRVNEEPEPNTTYNIHVSYFEIYNEHVRDLLIPHTKNRDTSAHYLKIRESPSQGVYVQGLTDSQVKSFEDIQALMEVGDQNRTTASTKMNQTSSRSHAVFTITLKQIQHFADTDETIERTARMRLVDLAGSERASKTEAKGQRLLEGGKINKSLTTLGRVIAALADPKRQSQTSNGAGSGRNSPRPGSGRSMRPFSSKGLEVVPYRDSVLTWLLKDSLGGNSKTAMVACISPSASDYDETLSTLRYADQAKRIRTRATANIDAVSAAERDAEIKVMADTIRTLQLSVSMASERKKEEMEILEHYQDQVDKMQRLMEETRQIGEARLRAVQEEVEALRPANIRMKGEIEALRRHVTLVTAELKNPIIIPPDLAVDKQPHVGEAASYYDTNNSFMDATSNQENVVDTSLTDDIFIAKRDSKITNPDTTSLPLLELPFPNAKSLTKKQRDEIHSDAMIMMKDLELFRKKCRDDSERFGKDVRKLVRKGTKSRKRDKVLASVGIV